MNQAVEQALEIAGIGLPVMFFVIGLFIIVGKILLKVFPEKSES
ncbi:MAG: OadG-related small transporter subunit [Bacillota bacterium]